MQKSVRDHIFISYSHQDQAIFGKGRVARLGEQDRLDLLQKLALEAKNRLNERCSASNLDPVADDAPAR